jgi:hypothetical protein
MGYNPKIWGPEAWHFIHFVALNYPVNPTEIDKKRYSRFFNSLQHTLPCEGCAYNYAEKIKKTPPRLESRKSLFEWTVDMHNEVNISNGKPKVSYDDALAKINDKREMKVLKESFSITSFGLLFILFSFLVFRD